MAKTRVKLTENKSLEKKKAMESVDRVLRQRRIILFFLIFALFFLKKFFKPFPTSNIITVLLLILSSFIFLPTYFIKKKRSVLSAQTIYLIIAITFVAEFLIFFSALYLLIPILTYYFGSIFFPAAFFIALYVMFSNPIFNSRKYSYFFFALGCLALLILGAFDYFGIYPSYPFYPVEYLYHTYQLKNVLLPLSIGFIFLSVMQVYLDNFWEMFRKQASELEKLNEELEDRVEQRTRELKKSKEELEERVRDLTAFHKLTIGRELKMSELKEEIKRLEEKLKKKE